MPPIRTLASLLTSTIVVCALAWPLPTLVLECVSAEGPVAFERGPARLSIAQVGAA